jgi:hypothetical protein
MRYASRILMLVFSLAVLGTAWGADPRYPDWPCAQIKVPDISLAAVWAGPPIDDVGNAWQQDDAMRTLVARLAARRTSLDEAEKAISDFVVGDQAERQRKAKLIVAGLFDSLNRERSAVMDGIERYSRRQQEFAKQIRSAVLELHGLQDRPDRDQSKIDELAARVEWETRVFEERRKTISYVCEVPVLIEQRLFALLRMIQQALE